MRYNQLNNNSQNRNGFGTGWTATMVPIDRYYHQSMSRKDNCLDNSMMENFFGLMKSELLYLQHWDTIDDFEADTNLLSNELLRRDQIWFTKKDAVENSSIYSLLKAHEESVKLSHAPRNDSNYQKNYVQGEYGAVPEDDCSEDK